MTELERAVAQVTGESRSTISERGFSLFDPFRDSEQECPQVTPHLLDWDAFELGRTCPLTCDRPCPV